MATLTDFVYVQPGSIFGNICNVSVFAVNLVYYLVTAGLTIFFVYLIAKSIYGFMQADSSETFEKLKENATGIILTAIGLLVVGSAAFFPKLILQTMGVSDANNPFINFGGCSGEDLVTGASGVEVGASVYIPGEGIGLPGAGGAGGGGGGTPSWALTAPSTNLSAPVVVAAPGEVLAGTVTLDRTAIIESNRAYCTENNMAYIDPTPEVWQVEPPITEWICCEGYCPSLSAMPISPPGNTTPETPGEGSTPLPTSNQIPSSTQMACSSDPIQANAINVATFNMGDGNELCNGCTQNPNDATTLAGAIRDFNLDIFALQEVGNNSKGTQYATSADQLTAAIQAMYPGKAFYTSVSQHGSSSSSFANMIVSKYPLKNEQSYPLTTDGEITRYLQAATAETPHGDLLIFNIHTKLQNSCDQTAQALNLIKNIAAGKDYVVLGDFNIQLDYILGNKGTPSCNGIPSDVKQYFDSSCYGYTCSQQLQPDANRDIDHILTSKGNTSISQKCVLGNYGYVSDAHSVVSSTIVLK